MIQPSSYSGKIRLMTLKALCSLLDNNFRSQNTDSKIGEIAWVHLTRQTLDDLDLIGSGGFGAVYRNKLNDLQVAIKVLTTDHHKARIAF